MKANSIAFALCALLLMGACSNEPEQATNGAAAVETPAVTVAQSQLTPEQLGELGAEIQKNPDDAQRILSQRGLNEQTFEQAVRKVSEDPAASRKYAESYKKASA